jgi:hypothetical protein
MPPPQLSAGARGGPARVAGTKVVLADRRKKLLWFTDPIPKTFLNSTLRKITFDLQSRGSGL